YRRIRVSDEGAARHRDGRIAHPGAEPGIPATLLERRVDQRRVQRSEEGEAGGVGPDVRTSDLQLERPRTVRHELDPLPPVPGPNAAPHRETQRPVADGPPVDPRPIRCDGADRSVRV